MKIDGIPLKAIKDVESGALSIETESSLIRNE